MIIAVIGKNFGDEGKGLAVDRFCGRAPFSLVVKHNGGAQAGHTVCFDGRRFVFHQLSSGSFRRADTYFAATYFPDLFKLGEEMADFDAIRPCPMPRICCNLRTPLILIYDVILNMALETARGDARHGSCGMGIDEGDRRTRAGFGVCFGDVLGMTEEALAARMREIRRDYVLPRFTDIAAESAEGVGRLREYRELLDSESVPENAAREMLRNAERLVPVADETAFLRSQEHIVFESGQGLLLDAENRRFAPHVTASRTGLANVAAILGNAGLSLDEVCYVTRTYVTRHGAGELPRECDPSQLGSIGRDLTNVPNPWQGSLRYAPHGSPEEFTEAVNEDLKTLDGCRRPAVSLCVTHLNETGGCVVCAGPDGGEPLRIPLGDFVKMPNISRLFDRVYCSFSEEENI